MTTYRLGTFRRPCAPSYAGLEIAGEVVPLKQVTPATPTVAALLADWPAAMAVLDAAVRDMRATGDWADAAQPATDLEPDVPFVPGRVFQSGANYHRHVVDLVVARALEHGEDEATARADAISLMDERVAHGTPYVFLGLPTAMCGAFDDVILPPTGDQHDWELELGVVIGTSAYRIRRDDAWAHVAGYVIVNDLTTRDRVFRPDLPGIGTDWLAGKNAPTFLPAGPWLVPARFVADPGNLRITLRLNDQTMQDESTSDMIFDIPRLIEHISSICPLLPGDLILTGSPAGNGAHHQRYLRAGDVMTATITGLGAQRNACVAAP
jgi:2,4-didehydro-3-deoxy-L-rhamnonate hydrolase